MTAVRNEVPRMFRDELTKKFSLLEDLPTLPSIIFELERMLHSDSASIQEIAVVVEEDPAIAASVLRVANSVVYFSSMYGRIVSLRDALVRLGLQEVQRLVSAAAIIKAFGNLGRHLDMKRFWQQSLRTAVCMRMIARSASGKVYIDEDEAYMAGLLHDIGLLILDQYFPDVYERLQADIAARARPRPEAEQAQLGLDHGQIGGCLLEQWNLPPELVEAVTWHNQPDQAGADARTLARAVRAAETVTDALESEDTSEETLQFINSQPFWEEVAFGPEAVAAITEETRQWSTPVFALL